MARLRGRAALINFYYQLSSQRPGYIALQVLFCLPLLPLFFTPTTEFSPFFEFIEDVLPAAKPWFIHLLPLVLLAAWLFILAWQERLWGRAYYTAARGLLQNSSLLLFILEPEYVETLAPQARLVSQAAGEQRHVSDVVSRVRHFLRHYSRYQRALLIWREKYAPPPHWRASVRLFLTLTAVAAGVYSLFFLLLGLSAVSLPVLAVFPLAGLALLKRQARNNGLALAVFEELTGGAAVQQGCSHIHN